MLLINITLVTVFLDCYSWNKMFCIVVFCEANIITVIKMGGMLHGHHLPNEMAHYLRISSFYFEAFHKSLVAYICPMYCELLLSL